MVTATRRTVGFLLLSAVALDSVLVGWLVYSAASAGRWALGALVSILVPAGLYGLYRLLDRVEARSASNGRHGK